MEECVLEANFKVKLLLPHITKPLKRRSVGVYVRVKVTERKKKSSIKQAYQ